MKIHHKYSITEIEDMVPYERDWYVNLIIQHMREKSNPPPGDDGGYSAMLEQFQNRKQQQ